MSCPNCGTTNRDGAAFCRHCGRLLRDACPRCAAAAAPDDNFCDACGCPLSPRAWTGTVAGNRPPAAAGQSTQPSGAKLPASTAPSLPSSQAQGPDPSFPLDRFIPRELLGKLTAARGTTAERRVVTMLFCDLKGSTAFAEQLDPEEWTEIVNGAFEQMVRPVYKYEGTVARLMGDGLLAFFGAPIAHEDDPRRAVLAGLAIIDGIRAYRAGLPPAAAELDVRVGINTGLVVVGAVGSDLRLEYSAIGDAINLAARMEQAAAPGTVQIAEDTYRLIAGQFEVETLGGIPVKGKAQPVMAYRVLRRAGGHTPRAGASLRSALVNRRMAWQALEEAFAALGAGRGGIVFLTGDAGLGKTRLIDEAIERLLPRHAPGRLHQASAVSYETTQPYGLLSRLLRQALGLMPGDPGPLVRERVAAVAGAEDVPILEALFGVAPAGDGHEAGDDFARRLDAVLASFATEQTAGGPLVVALDELQWLDASSADRLAVLFQLTESAPILFLCALRRERRSPGWGLMETAGRDLPHRLSEIALHPLNDSESRMMLAGLLDSVVSRGAAELPDSLAMVVLEKAEGNPLFLEEVVRHLIERGVLSQDGDGGWATGAWGDVPLPDSLQALLTARIDRLDEPTRRTLQAASVIGRVFARSPLAALVDDPEALDRRLVELQRMELIREVNRIPEPEYSFSHSLTQEAVYNTILLKQRRAMHLRVAESIEAKGGGAGEIATVLARHFIEGDAPRRALPYLMEAAAGALRLHAPAEAIALYERALPIALAAADNTSHLIEINDNQGRALELLSRFTEAKALYEEFERRALAQDDKRLELATLIAQGKLYSNVTPYYDAAHGRRLMERAMALAEQTDDQAAEARILWNLVNIDRFDIDALDKALTNGERGVALARKLGLLEVLAYLLNDLGDIYATGGMFDKSARSLAEARQLWRDLGNEAMLADSLTSTALWESIFGQQRTAMEFAAEAGAIASRIGNIWGEAYSKGVHGNILALMGAYDQAIAEMQETMRKAKTAGFIGGQVIVSSYLSRVYLEAGDPARAIEAARTGAEIGRKHLPQFAGMCIGRQALGHLAEGDIGAAAQLLDDPLAADRGQQIFVRYDINLARVNLALAERRDENAAALASEFLDYFSRIRSESWLPEFYEAKARALAGLGRPDEALEQLSQAVALARQHELHSNLWRYVAAAAGLEEARGHRDEAAALWGEAAIEIDYLKPHWPDDLRDTFMARPDVRRVMASRLEHTE